MPTVGFPAEDNCTNLENEEYCIWPSFIRNAREKQTFVIAYVRLGGFAEWRRILLHSQNKLIAFDYTVPE